MFYFVATFQNMFGSLGSWTSSWSDGSIKVWELNFAGPVPDEGDHPTELEGNRGIDDTCNDPKTFEAIDDKECQDNGCNPLMVKWLAKMKGDVSRSRLVCREIKEGQEQG